MRSGTNVIGAKELNRNFLGFEIVKEYFDFCNNQEENLLKIENKWSGLDFI